MSEETNAEPIMRFRKVEEGEVREWERKEWAIAKQEVDLYFVPKLMEYEHFKKWYVPNILNWHTPNVMDGGAMLSAAVKEKEVHSNDDGGWISRPSDRIGFILGKDSFIGMTTRYSVASCDRNSEDLYHLHIDPENRKVLVDKVEGDELCEHMRQWLLKHNMVGVVFKRKIHPDTFGPQVVLKRFRKDPYLVDMEDPSLIDEPMQVDMIKVLLGLTGDLG